jgi:hypothetical protein
VDSDRELQSQFRRALDEVLPPVPWLESAVGERLREHRSKGAAKRGTARRSTRRLRLAAGFVAMVVAVAVVVTFLALHFAPTAAVPASPAQQIKAYQAMLATDKAKELATATSACNLGDTACPARIALWRATDQRWLDDLKRAMTPPRFAAVDALMRRHIARSIIDDDAMVTAWRTNDQAALSTALTASDAEIVATYSLADDIITSSQGTVGSYIAGAQTLKANLLACTKCQPLLSTSGLSCQAAITCADDIEAIRVEVESFQGRLAHVYAPDSLAANDRLLQLDLVSVDTTLDAIERDLAAGHQPLVETDQAELRHALGRVDADVANIVGS